MKVRLEKRTVTFKGWTTRGLNGKPYGIIYKMKDAYYSREWFPCTITCNRKHLKGLKA